MIEPMTIDSLVELLNEQRDAAAAAEGRRLTAERKQREATKRARATIADLRDQVANLQAALTAAKGARARYAGDWDPCQRALQELFAETWEAKTVGRVPCLRSAWIPVKTVMRWRSLIADGGAS